MRVFARRYPIPFWNDRAISGGGWWFLPLNWLTWQRPLRYRKRKDISFTSNSISTTGCKYCENWSSEYWDTLAPSEQVRYDTKLDFWNREILLVIVVQTVETHQHAKFRHNRSIGCEDINIFRFFKMSAVCHLGFVWGIFGPPTVSTWMSLSLCKIWLWSMQ